MSTNSAVARVNGSVLCACLFYRVTDFVRSAGRFDAERMPDISGGVLFEGGLKSSPMRLRLSDIVRVNEKTAYHYASQFWMGCSSSVQFHSWSENSCVRLPGTLWPARTQCQLRATKEMTPPPSRHAHLIQPCE